MDIRPGYKQTEVGIIPEDWQVTSVAKEFDVRLGKMLDSEKNRGTPKPYIGNRAVQWGMVDVAELSFVLMTRSDIERFRLRRGDLLVCEGGDVGRAAIWEAPIDECYYQKAIHRLRPLKGFQPRLMQAIMQHYAEQGFLSNYVTQTSIAHLPREKFLLVPLPLPPLIEQRAIAEALGDVDALLLGLDRLIAKKRDLKQAAMQQLLTGKTRLPGFSGDWEVKRLGDLFSFKNGLNKEKSFFGRGIPIVNYMDVFGSSFLMSSFIDGCVDVNSDEIRNFGIKRGDVLFTRTSETANEVGLSSVMLDCPKRMVFSGFLIRAREKEHILHNEYKSYCLRSLVVRAQIVSKASYTTRALTSGRALSSVILPIPQYSEQVAIAEVLSDMDAELMALEAQRDKTRLLKQGMMQELLTGRTRLV